MRLYITQKSYFFVHKHFISFFKKDKVKILYVTENTRGITKKYFEIIKNFGIVNTFICSCLEIIYFLKFFKIESRLNKVTIKDSDLNFYLDNEISNNDYQEIISIGCPCKIDPSLKEKYSIKIVNLHGGIIPYQKGRFSPIKSLKKGHKYLGASIYEITDEFDEGDVLSQDYFEVSSSNKIYNYSKVLSLSAGILNAYLAKEHKLIPNNILKSLI